MTDELHSAHRLGIRSYKQKKPSLQYHESFGIPHGSKWQVVAGLKAAQQFGHFMATKNAMRTLGDPNQAVIELHANTLNSGGS